MIFRDLNLDERLLEGLSSMGFEQATPIQEQAIPIILEGKDLIASAQTGTGKTAAFLLPILHQLTQQPREEISTLILVPTRELAMQIDEQLEAFAYFTEVSSIPIYGGQNKDSFEQEKKL
ncbi:MAG: DEAD/DEAH box helicase [Saprospiraceae bacterium]|nr:DEAD/DEAH box helicase [Saprospiraceae bacterium]